MLYVKNDVTWLAKSKFMLPFDSLVFIKVEKFITHILYVRWLKSSVFHWKWYLRTCSMSFDIDDEGNESAFCLVKLELSYFYLLVSL